MFPYESPNLQQDIDEVWEMIRPLYEELHAYIRRKLRDLYGPEKIGSHSLLPAHILGIYNFNSIREFCNIDIIVIFLNIVKYINREYLGSIVD